MDRIHEEKFDVEDRFQKVREELEDIKRQNEEYQKNLGLMAKVSASTQVTWPYLELTSTVDLAFIPLLAHD